MIDETEIGKRIRKFRLRKNLTLQMLADRTGRSMAPGAHLSTTGYLLWLETFSREQSLKVWARRLTEEHPSPETRKILRISLGIPERSQGAPVELTSVEHPSGTDRVAELARRDPYRDYDIIANIQGDEPLLQEQHLAAAVRLVTDDAWDVGTCATPIETHEGRKDPSVVKVARAASGRALYFSRARIPYQRDGTPDADALGREPFLRHIGIYAYRRDALERWVALQPSPLEQIEQLEQLRPLEAGVRIGVALVGKADPGVDTPADAVRMEERLRELGGSPYAESGA